MNSKWQELRNAAEKAQAAGEYQAAERLWYEVLHESASTRGRRPQTRPGPRAFSRMSVVPGKVLRGSAFSRRVGFSIYTGVYGTKHIDSASMLANLGLLQVMLRNLAVAEPLLCDALDVKRMVLGANHPALRRLEDTYRDVVARLKSDESPAGIVSAKQWSKTGRFEPVEAAEALPRSATSRQTMLSVCGCPLFESAKENSLSGDWQQWPRRRFPKRQNLPFILVKTTSVISRPSKVWPTCCKSRTSIIKRSRY